MEGLEQLEREAKNTLPNTVKYWKLRCNYLEKSLDETYSDKERKNCYNLYRILLHREK